MLPTILIAIALLIGVFVVVVASRPSDFKVGRSMPIAGPPDIVFSQVNVLRNWEAWSPWAKLDPAARKSYAGPPAGQGASFAWAGNAKIGQGKMTITDSRPNDLVRFQLDFLKPFKATHTAEFTFRPQGGDTLVTWTMSGKANFIAKAMGLFLNFDKMMGGQFEQGLAQMNAAVAGSLAKK